MPEDIAKALAYQVKKEIAERYFGHRKVIEEDSNALKKALAYAAEFYECSIGRDLVRIYSLLSDRKLIERLMKELNWEETPFYDEYVIKSKTIRARLMEGIDSHGWTASSRLANLLFDSYERLFRDTQRYRDLADEVKENAQVIAEEIRLFQERFALDEILGFISSLDRDELSEVLGKNLPSGQAAAIAERLRIQGPQDPDKSLPRVPVIPRPDKIKKLLKCLAGEAYKAQKKNRD